VACFADGSVKRGEAGRVWALDVVLHDGRVVTASGTSSGKRDARPETLTAIRQAAERRAIPAKLTGTAAKRGSRESPANPWALPRSWRPARAEALGWHTVVTVPSPG
jgi:hypothetical protein